MVKTKMRRSLPVSWCTLWASAMLRGACGVERPLQPRGSRRVGRRHMHSCAVLMQRVSHRVDVLVAHDPWASLAAALTLRRPPAPVGPEVSACRHSQECAQAYVGADVDEGGCEGDMSTDGDGSYSLSCAPRMAPVEVQRGATSRSALGGRKNGLPE